jgi:hypothetical protein
MLLIEIVFARRGWYLIHYTGKYIIIITRTYMCIYIIYYYIIYLYIYIISARETKNIYAYIF